MNFSEHEIQVSLVDWFRWQYPQYIMFANENGAHLAGDAKQRACKIARMKKAGHVNGVSDLFLMAPKQGKAGLFIEMKAKRGIISDAQKEFIESACKAGYQAEVCYSFEQAKEVIEQYLKI